MQLNPEQERSIFKAVRRYTAPCAIVLVDGMGNRKPITHHEFPPVITQAVVRTATRRPDLWEAWLNTAAATLPSLHLEIGFRRSDPPAYDAHGYRIYFMDGYLPVSLRYTSGRRLVEDDLDREWRTLQRLEIRDDDNEGD